MKLDKTETKQKIVLLVFYLIVNVPCIDVW